MATHLFSPSSPSSPLSLFFRFAPVALLSAGPVGIGDGIGYTNATLVSSLCRTDGVLLSPSYSATPIDATYGTKPPTGEIWQANSQVGNLTYVFVLGVDVAEAYSVGLSAVWPRLHGAHVAFTALGGAGCSNVSQFQTCGVSVTDEQPLVVHTGPQVLLEHAYTLYTIAPVLSNG